MKSMSMINEEINMMIDTQGKILVEFIKREKTSRNPTTDKTLSITAVKTEWVMVILAK